MSSAVSITFKTGLVWSFGLLQSENWTAPIFPFFCLQYVMILVDIFASEPCVTTIKLFQEKNLCFTFSFLVIVYMHGGMLLLHVPSGDFLHRSPLFATHLWPRGLSLQLGPILGCRLLISTNKRIRYVVSAEISEPFSPKLRPNSKVGVCVCSLCFHLYSVPFLPTLLEIDGDSPAGNLGLWT